MTTENTADGARLDPLPCSRCGRSVVSADAIVERAALETEKLRGMLKNTIAELLINHGIIHALSIEDAEDYDNFETADNVMRFTLALESLLFQTEGTQ